MPKTPGTYAFFDVAKEPVLKLMSAWREQYAKDRLDATLTGSFSRCNNANNSAFTTWRTERALTARLISVCAHGTSASVTGCVSTTDIYLKANVSTYHEVPKAIIHLLACETLDELADALVDRGGAT